MNEIKIPDFILRFVKLPMNKLFGLSENCFQAILTGLTGGYPVGVKNAVALYKNNFHLFLQLLYKQTSSYAQLNPTYLFLHRLP